jgi:TM2 domain-containing membrane protein YozV
MRDLRQYAAQTQTRLIAGGLILLFIVGDGLIYVIYGSQAALLGLFCLGAGLIPLLLIVLILYVIDWIVRREKLE